jgi:hypothetical protein
MAPNRITRGGATLALFLIVGILAGCGGGGGSTGASATDVTTPTPSSDEAADGAILNTVLTRQQAAVKALAAVTHELSPHLARMADYFRAQEQEHVDAVVKALRGLKSPAEPVVEEIELPGATSDREWLVFLYEVESQSIDAELGAVSALESSWPRSLLASTVADQAQHLTLLRQALGEGPLRSVPVPFENGTAPPPE